MMHEFEGPLWSNGAAFIIGIDEAGRGPIAGPLVVAAVVLPKWYHHPIINDSKKLSAKKREQLFDVIISDAIAYHIEIIEPSVIDQDNIYQATKKGMERCVEQLGLSLTIDHVLTDAMPINYDAHTAIIKGDTLSISIAAASILAKVTRDRIMQDYACLYPLYGFEKHKGYPTKQHCQAIMDHGITMIHRHSFEPVKSYVKNLK